MTIGRIGARPVALGGDSASISGTVPNFRESRQNAELNGTYTTFIHRLIGVFGYSPFNAEADGHGGCA